MHVDRLHLPAAKNIHSPVVAGLCKTASVQSRLDEFLVRLALNSLQNTTYTHTSSGTTKRHQICTDRSFLLRIRSSLVLFLPTQKPRCKKHTHKKTTGKKPLNLRFVSCNRCPVGWGFSHGRRQPQLQLKRLKVVLRRCRSWRQPHWVRAVS